MSNNNGEFTIYMPWVAIKLVVKGFPIKRTQPNPAKPKMEVFIFEDSKELRDAITLITKK